MFLDSFRFLSSVCLLAASFVLAGCGAGPQSLAPTTSVDALSGIVHGGPNPISGATVQYYATTSGGYGAAAALLATAVTDANGNFTFVSPSTCNSGQQAYVTVQGGNPGSGSNPNYLLMAALGPCSMISSSTVIWISEVTTVAAAETLRPFMSITSANSLYVVNVGAPLNNNAAMGTCTLSGTATTGCVAAGLSHAFANALNLANSVSINGVAPSGQAYAVAPSNPSSQVPQALINSMANSVQACVNSGGGSAGDSSPCGNLFTATTTPGTGASAPTNTLQAILNLAQYPASNVALLYAVVPPTAFYQPTLTTQPTDYSVAIVYTGVTTPGKVGTISVTAPGSGYTSVPTVTLSGGGSPTMPAIAVASLGVVSLAFTPNTNTTCTAPVLTFSGGGAPVISAVATAQETGGVITGVTITNPGSGYTSVPTVAVTGATKCNTATVTATLGVLAVPLTNPGAGYTSAPTVTIAGNGAGATATASYATTPFGSPYVEILDANDDVYLGSQNIQAGSGGAYAFYPAIESNGASLFVSAPNTTYVAPRGLGVDTLGNLWATDNNSTTVVEMNATTGNVLTTFITSIAPFPLAIDKENNVWYAGNQIFELLAASNYTPATFATKSTFKYPPHAIAFDPSQNVWVSQYNSAGGTAYGGVYPNIGTAATPAYGSASAQVQLAGTTNNNTVGIAIDGSGNAWEPASTGLYELQGTGSPITVVAAATGSPFAADTVLPNFDSVDGAGSVWVANNGGGGQNVIQYIIGTNTAYTYSPCYLATNETACETTSISTAQRTEVDSTGAVWVTSLANGRLYQILGPGTPTWPELSLSNPGVMPQ